MSAVTAVAVSALVLIVGTIVRGYSFHARGGGFEIEAKPPGRSNDSGGSEP
jgi:hypothetical protein